MRDLFTDHLAIWDRLAEEDPFWAVLSDPAKRGGGWDPEAFFATGRGHVALLEQQLQAFGQSFAGRRALDFGCGLGRLTQAIAATASFTLGVDASVGMVVGAQRWNRAPERCAYLLNRAPDLEMLPDGSFGAVVSFIVLQHIPPPASHRYLTELARLVGPGGFLLVQVPDEVVVADLPEQAFRSEVRIRDAPSHLPAGGRAEVAVEVTNASTEAWRPRPGHRLRAGNHWVALDGGRSTLDDGRVALEPVEPGETRAVRLPVVAPDQPGRYRLEVDLVVEGQAWFADRGARPALAEVRVGAAAPASGSAAGADSEAEGQLPMPFGMWPIPRPEVSRLLGEGGLEVVEVQPDSSSGDGWISWRYLAVRR